MRTIALLFLTLAAAPCLAGNARSDRTAWTYRQDRARAGRFDQQFAGNFHGQQMDMARYYRGKDSRFGTMQEQHRRAWQSWRDHAPQCPPPQYYQPVYVPGPRYR